MIAAAKRNMQDASIPGLSEEGRFTLLYGVAYAISLAAMRWHGYRSNNRYLVFQCLQHTVGLDSVKWRILDQCYNARNLAEYEGHLEISPQLMIELEEITNEIILTVERFGSVQDN